ncbi:MAG: hydroxymethylglutaryl-CoA lyase [Saprospiraceae bacterium]|nr:hydroxymethylglutaryl-CoA lyase [Saprospiraceae bacterium]
MKIIECPRDAMQGIKNFIPTEHKITYLNELLKVGFDTLDFGSFVSPKAIPQMRDTAAVLGGLDLNTATKLLAIVANTRGASQACEFEEIKYLGYPFSISETFQLRNTNASIEDSMGRLLRIKELADKTNKEVVVYLSMGFGNPYGDPWNVEIVAYWVDQLTKHGFSILQLSDTIGVATPESIAYLFSGLISEYPDIEIGAHLHTKPNEWEPKIHAAYENGCRRFDGAFKGYGGCPMAKDDLTGNMPTEHILNYFNKLNLLEGYNLDVAKSALNNSNSVYSYAE